MDRISTTSRCVLWSVTVFQTCSTSSDSVLPGRTVKVSGGNVQEAIKKLDEILGKNRVRRELRLTERHEKKGVKRRRLSSERWRTFFANEVSSPLVNVDLTLMISIGSQESTACKCYSTQRQIFARLVPTGALLQLSRRPPRRRPRCPGRCKVTCHLGYIHPGPISVAWISFQHIYSTRPTRH